MNFSLAAIASQVVSEIWVLRAGSKDLQQFVDLFKGLSAFFMDELHRLSKVTPIYLKLNKCNQTAMQLYKTISYVFKSEEEGQYVGYLG